MGRSNNHIIQTNNLEKLFDGKIAVENLTFSVPRGKIFGFVGPSGSGKTTTIRMLTGFLKPTRGEVSVFDQKPFDFPADTRENIGYMPQLFVLYQNLSVRENLSFVASLYGLSPFGRKERFDQLLEVVEMRGEGGKLARDLSGGMQRRLSLAATLLHNPELIFLDEPTAGIDPVLRRKFWDYFNQLRDQGHTLFITTQYVSEASYCDLVGVISEGRLISVDTPKGLRYKAFGGDIVELRTEEPINFSLRKKLENLPFVRSDLKHQGARSVRMVVDEARTDVPKIIAWADKHNLKVDSVEEQLPGFDDVFVELISTDRNNHE